jgi:hypothetical protein
MHELYQQPPRNKTVQHSPEILIESFHRKRMTTACGLRLTAHSDKESSYAICESYPTIIASAYFMHALPSAWKYEQR